MLLSLIHKNFLLFPVIIWLLIFFLISFFREPNRFDVVVAQSPIEPGKHLLKRIIGLPNEQVRLVNNTVAVVTAEGQQFILREPYLNRNEIAVYKDQTVRLGDDQYFLLGDNRTNSLDSRVWGGLTRDHIVGRVILRLYPFAEATVHPGTVDIEASHTL